MIAPFFRILFSRQLEIVSFFDNLRPDLPPFDSCPSFSFFLRPPFLLFLRYLTIRISEMGKIVSLLRLPFFAALHGHFPSCYLFIFRNRFQRTGKIFRVGLVFPPSLLDCRSLSFLVWTPDLRVKFSSSPRSTSAILVPFFSTSRGLPSKGQGSPLAYRVPPSTQYSLFFSFAAMTCLGQFPDELRTMNRAGTILSPLITFFTIFRLSPPRSFKSSLTLQTPPFSEVFPYPFVTEKSIDLSEMEPFSFGGYFLPFSGDLVRQLLFGLLIITTSLPSRDLQAFPSLLLSSRPHGDIR